ncbi:MAG TPA: ABC transporter permease [Mucilaginibacter sp.]
MANIINLKITWRYLLKDRLSLFLNVAGLSTGLTCALLIYLWVNDELRIDRFHSKGDRLYHVMENRIKSGGTWTAPTTAGPTAEALKKEYPEIDQAVTVRSTGEVLLSSGEHIMRSEGKYVSKDFFDMFTYPVLTGNVVTALEGDNTMLISDKLAVALFGSMEQAVGQQVEWQHERRYFVSGVFKAPGRHSSDQFDFVLPIEQLFKTREQLRGWGSTSVGTYVTLKPGQDASAFNKKLKGFLKKISNGEVKHRTTFITLYANEYLYGDYENGAISGGRIDYVRLFSIIALFILFIACINFMNLSTAKATLRAKEVSVKKVVGAGRGQLIMQYLGESLLVTILSALPAIELVKLVLPAFNALSGKQLIFNLDIRLILVITGITVITGLIAGSYPALFLSRFKPGLIFKGKIRTAAGEIFARKGLVVFQFALSVFLVIAVLAVYKQMQYLQSKNLGFNKENLIVFDKEGKLDSAATSQAFLAEVRQLPSVVNASMLGHSLTGHNSGTFGVQWPGRDPNDKTEFETIFAGYGMAQTLGMTIKQGREYEPAYRTDSAGIIFNEAAITYMGLKDPIGKQVTLWGKQRHIVGVVGDFNFESLHKTIGPAFILLDNDAWRYVVRVKKGREKETVDGIGKLYARFNPGFTLDYKFLDEQFQRMYAAEAGVSVLSRYFAGLAIGISCLGLFGLTAFTAQRRQKEISIRKVIGASPANIAMMLSKDFLRLVLMAILIAFPLSWWAVNQWLKGFAYRIGISASIFLFASAAILFITIIIISFQSLRAARTNPVKYLKSE